jgi:hypothetical protein
MPDPSFIGSLLLHSIGILAVIFVWVAIIAVIKFSYEGLFKRKD